MYNPYIFRNFSPGEIVPEIKSFLKSNPEGVDLIKDIVSKPEDEQTIISDISIEHPEVPIQEPIVASIVDTVISKSPITSNNFKSKMMSTYEKILKEKGISKDYAKYLVAQDALESNWGNSSLSDVNNFGGIKATGNSPYIEKWTTEYIDGKNKKVLAKFRKFDNLEDYARYKVNLLNNKRYMAFSGDKEDFFNKVKRGGYATDRDYVSKLNRILNSMKNGGDINSDILKNDKPHNISTKSLKLGGLIPSINDLIK